MPVSERTATRVSVAFGVAVVALGVTLLVTRMNDEATPGLAGLPAVPWVRVAAVLLAVALLCAAFSESQPAAKIASTTIAIGVLVAAVPSTIARFAQPSFDIKEFELFLRGARVQPHDPGFLNPAAPVLLAILSVALLLLLTRRAKPVLGALALLIVTFGLLNVLSILYGGAVAGSVGWRASWLVGSYAALFGLDVVLLAGPTTWPFSAFAGTSVRAVMLRWLTPFTILVVLGTDILTIRVFPHFSSALGSITNALASVIAAVVMASSLSRLIGDRLDRVQTALHDAAQRLQHLSRRILAVQEEERRHLSRELHDEFGQLLATISVQVHAAKGLAGEDARPRLEECIVLLQRAGTEVRNLALELRPVMLETAGLDATLRWLADQYQQRMDIPIEVVGDVNHVAGDCAIVLFRVVQESLTNTVRHAAARHVWIELKQNEHGIELVVRDDGVGFDVTRTMMQSAHGGRLGLLGMRERVHLVDGSLDVDSAPGRGTQIRVRLRPGATVLNLEGGE
ncbi:MAG: sensor histidine kinase [Gemmatimonadaceae bacterium]